MRYSSRCIILLHMKSLLFHYCKNSSSITMLCGLEKIYYCYKSFFFFDQKIIFSATINHSSEKNESMLDENKQNKAKQIKNIYSMCGFSFSKSITKKAFCWNISSNINFLFLKSERTLMNDNSYT